MSPPVLSPRGGAHASGHAHAHHHGASPAPPSASASAAVAAAAAAEPTSPSTYGLHVTASMDSGNIEVLDAPDSSTLNLAIRPDPYCDTDKRAHFQWFNFRCAGGAGRQVTLRITNAGGASYPSAWSGYSACASYDMEDWFRVPTSYDAASGVLTITHTPAYDVVQYAYFAPYTADRHARLLARSLAAARPDMGVRLTVLGRTQEGRHVDLITVGSPADAAAAAATAAAAVAAPAQQPAAAAAAAAPARPQQQDAAPSTSSPAPAPAAAATSYPPRLHQPGLDAPPQPPPTGSGGRALRIWVTARQHPGESMAEWFAEGLLERLADPQDGVARSLLGRAVFHVVPCMCPDGAARGHLRTNAAGVNLNRSWADPCPATAPEVAAVRNAMDAEGVDFLLDVHGDEELPAVFVAGLRGIPRWGPRLEGLQSAFCAAYSRHAPEFQTRLGYPPAPLGRGNLSIASKQVGQRFDCLAMTLEMPFKDSADVPDARVGWSPGRAKRLGAALLGALREVLDQLR